MIFRDESKKQLNAKFLIQPETANSTVTSYHRKTGSNILSSPKKKKRLPILPPDPLQHYRGATMGPGAYEIKRDLLPKKPKSHSHGVGFNSRSIRFDFMEPKRNTQPEIKISREEEIMNSLIFSKNTKKKRRKIIPLKYNKGNFSKEDRFKDVSIIPDKSRQPGPGAYDIKGFASADYKQVSAFFRSNSQRLAGVSEVKSKNFQNSKKIFNFFSFHCWTKSESDPG